MHLTSPYLWYITRATGLVALVLLTLVLVLGAMVSTRVGGRAVGRFELNSLHRSLSLMALAFVVLHVITTVIDSYVPIGILSAVVPLTSPYRRVGVAVGAVGFDVMVAVALSSIFKERIRFSSWRFIHWFSWLSFAAAALHGFLTGTDAHEKWSLAVTGVCVLVVAGAGLWRYTRRPVRSGGRTALSPPAHLGRRAQRDAAPRTTDRPSRPPAAAPRSPRPTSGPRDSVFPRGSSS